MAIYECIITGADFLDPVQKKYIHGDLFQMGDMLIFNGGKNVWVDAVAKPLPPASLAVMCEEFFERQGVIVFPLLLCQFNLAANLHLNKQMDEQDKLINRMKLQ